MTSDELLLEIGSEAYAELSTSEQTAIAAKYTVAQTRMAGLHAFQLLMKKFRPSYRMGKTYEALSQKFEAYRQIYNWYCQTVKAGKVTATSTQLDSVEVVDKDKFSADAN
jgi:hypothetical protein